MKSETLRAYSNSICQIGRDMLELGYKFPSLKLKEIGLRTLAAGLIQQNPLRDRNFDTEVGIFGKDFEQSV